MLRIRAGIAALPRISPKHGFTAPSEDALYLLSGRGNSVHGALADGVGGMAAFGLDPGAFPRALLRHSLAQLKRRAVTLAGSTPAAALAAGWAGVQAQPPPALQGACTACYFRLRLARSGGSAALEALNLGDCSLLVVRAGALHAAAPRSHRAFDTPHQLGQLLGSAASLFQAPAQAQPLACALAAGDHVLVCSDGLTDNLFAHEILAHVRSGAEQGRSAAEVALRLVADAHAKALDRSRDGPFALAAKEADRVWGAGGRVDDTTVLLLRLEAGGGAGAPLLEASEAGVVHTPCADAAQHLPVNLALEAPAGAGQKH